MAYLDNNGVLYLWGKIKAHVSSAVAGFYTKPSGGIPASDLATGVIPAVPNASTSAPLMDGTAAVGSETAFARGDHVHPSDTSKVDTISGYGLATIANNEGIYKISVQEGTNTPNHAYVVSAATFNTTVQSVQSAFGNYYTKTETDTAFEVFTTQLANKANKSDIASMYKYKGSVATVSALPSSDNTTGDVYNVESTGMNYAWNGSAWDALGETFSITAITNAEIDTICT